MSSGTVTGEVQGESKPVAQMKEWLHSGAAGAKVQGVFFRAATIKEAKKLGVVGHVKNTSSGTVTGEVQGEPKPASQMKDWLQHKGPSGAKIDKCSITNEKSDLDKLTYSSFEKR
ncbi:hypothetical protein WJX77_011248 [Trebouxia sp. C0004]